MAAFPRRPALNRNRGVSVGRRATFAQRPLASGGEPSDPSTPGSLPLASHPGATAGQAPSTASLDFQLEAVYWFNQNAHVQVFTLHQHSQCLAVSSESTQTAFSGNGVMLLAFWCTDYETVLINRTNRNPLLCQNPMNPIAPFSP